jgi:cytochrome c peroxidase
MKWSLCALAVLAVFPASISFATGDTPRIAHAAPNDSGVAVTLNASGRIDRSNPFFQSLGTNGRSCDSCHQAQDGWTVTPQGVQRRFARSDGLDPIFRPVDGANSPLADVSTRAARERAYSMLLSKGLIRVGIGIPDQAQFELAAVDDPYGYASARELSLFRRPLPTTNLRFLNTVMWDGRETFRSDTSTDCLFGTLTCFAPLRFDLHQQSNDATVGHAQAGVALTEARRKAIVDFQMELVTAQAQDRHAGRLDVRGAAGGPGFLSGQPAYFGINDTLVGDYRTHANFTPIVMKLYDAWALALPEAHSDDEHERTRGVAVARRAVARGQALFNEKPIAIAGVAGLNDDLSLPLLRGTCTTCHNTPSAGNHSVPMPLNIGLADASRRTLDMPLYTLRHKTSGQTVQTTDPGRALITGQWKDIGRFKGPTLRALAARAPYFHNGSARNLHEAVGFYNERFGIGFTDQEIDDLVAFLQTL